MPVKDETSQRAKCIYCGSPGPFSVEHPLPWCLGVFRNSPLLNNCICRTCNGRIGGLEQQLGRSGPEAYFRQRLGIAGRPSHDKIDPFQRGSLGAKPIDVIRSHPETGIPILWSIYGDEGHEVRQVVLFPEDGGSHPLRISDWMRNPEDVLNAIRDLKLSKIRKAIFFYSENDAEWVENLMRGLSGTGVFEQTPQSGPTVSYDESTIRFEVTDAYFRAIAKVGFHYILAVQHNIDGSMADFVDIRNYIMNGGSEEFVTCKKDMIIWHPPGYLPAQYLHVILVKSIDSYLEARVQFFLGPKFEPPVYTIRLAKDGGSLVHLAPQGHCYIFYPTFPQNGYYGEAVKLDILPK